MVANKALEDRVNSLEKSMGTVVKALREIKTELKHLGENGNKQQNEEIQEIIEKQKVINAIIIKNADAIERIDKEIARREKEASEEDIVQMVNTEKVVEIQKNYKSTNICKFWQSNSRKRNIKCDFLHVTMVSNDDKNQAHKSNYKCVSCKNACDAVSCVVRHHKRDFYGIFNMLSAKFQNKGQPFLGF